MKKVVIQFPKQNPELYKIYFAAINKIKEETSRYSWHFALANPAPGLPQKYPGIGIIPLMGFKRQRFGYVIDYSRCLKNGKDVEDVYTALCKELGHAFMDQSVAPLEKGLVFEGVFDPCDGYGNSTEQLVLALDRAHISMSFVPTRRNNNHLASAKFHELVNERNFLYKKYLLYHTPAITRTHGKCQRAEKYILTMFETTKVPSAWAGRINNKFNHLIVPSDFCKKIFKDAGVKVPIHKVPLGVNHKIWPMCENRAKRDKPFEFLLLANAHWSNSRKNYPLTLAAFKRAFGNRTDVKLILKISGGWGGNKPNLPSNVEVIDARLPHKELVSLMHRADCFLFPSNGEGYGLPPREAMCTGLPVILCNWSSLTEICKDDIAYWVNPSGLQRADLPKFLRSHNNGSDDFGQYAKINTDDLVEQMRHIVSHKREAFKKGKKAAQWVRKNENYDLSAKRLIEVMDL